MRDSYAIAEDSGASTPVHPARFTREVKVVRQVTGHYPGSVGEVKKNPLNGAAVNILGVVCPMWGTRNSYPRIDMSERSVMSHVPGVR